MGYKGRTDVKDDVATLALRVQVALTYSALIREDGSIYHRTFNGTGDMIVEKWTSRRIKPIDNGIEFFGRIYKRDYDYIRGIRLTAEYLGVPVENIGKLVENFWLKPSYIIMNPQKAQGNAQEKTNEEGPKKKKKSKQIIPRPNDGCVYFFNLDELNNVKDRLKKKQRLYSRKRVTEKQLKILNKAIKKKQSDVQKYYDGLKT